MQIFPPSTKNAKFGNYKIESLHKLFRDKDEGRLWSIHFIILFIKRLIPSPAVAKNKYHRTLLMSDWPREKKF